MDYDLATWNEHQLIRTRSPTSNPSYAFNSSDYLGLAKHPAIIHAAQHNLSHYGMTSGGSALVNGYHSVHRDFEQAFAAFAGFDAAIYFSSGYLANLAIFQSLMTHKDHVYYDQHCHASLIDGLLLSRVQRHRFPHRNYKQLTNLAANDTLLTNSVFSCDGTLADLPHLTTLLAQLIIDDAHGLGVLGKQGRGTLSHYALPSSVTLACYPLSKGFGGYGAMLCGKHEHINKLLQFARTYRYTTAIPPFFASAGLATLRILETEPWHQQKLQNNIEHYRQATEGLTIPHSITAIQAIPIGPAQKALHLQAALKEQGIHVGCLRPPSVPKNKSLLRLTLTTQHTIHQIDAVLSAINKCVRP